MSANKLLAADAAAFCAKHKQGCRPATGSQEPAAAESVRAFELGIEKLVSGWTVS